MSECEVDNVFIECELRLNTEIRSKVGDGGENDVLNFFRSSGRSASFFVLVDSTRDGSFGTSLRENELERLNCVKERNGLVRGQKRNSAKARLTKDSQIDIVCLSDGNEEVDQELGIISELERKFARSDILLSSS